MFIRIWANILFLLAFAYGSWQVITDQATINSWKYYLYLLSPWLLLFGSIRGWHRCFTWRRMIAGKKIAPELSRGQHKPSRMKQRPNILEHACLALFLISIAAILKQFGIDNAAMCIGVAIGAYVALRVTFRMVG